MWSQPSASQNRHPKWRARAYSAVPIHPNRSCTLSHMLLGTHLAAQPPPHTQCERVQTHATSASPSTPHRASFRTLHATAGLDDTLVAHVLPTHPLSLANASSRY